MVVEAEADGEDEGEKVEEVKVACEKPAAADV